MVHRPFDVLEDGVEDGLVQVDQHDHIQVVRPVVGVERTSQRAHV